MVMPLHCTSGETEDKVDEEDDLVFFGTRRGYEGVNLIDADTLEFGGGIASERGGALAVKASYPE